MKVLFDAEGKPLELHARVGEGGEATVRHVAGRDGVLAKVYKDQDDLAEHARKVVALVAMATPGLEKVAAWPKQLVVDDSGQAVGFLMEHLKGWTPLYNVYQTRSRLRQVPHGDWGFLVRVARNLAAAVSAVHRAGLVVGDLNESNVLVSGQAMVKLIDVDSFQVEVDGETLACPVGKAEYLAPELQGRDLDLHRRSPSHDVFALAVLVFQTLMLGRHPFAGRPCGLLEPSLEEALANHWYVYASERDVPLRPPPGMTVDWLPPAVRTLFERAFGPDVAARPTAKVWADVLKELESELTPCSPGHVYWKGLAACPWCRLERRSRTRLFGGQAEIAVVTVCSGDVALADLKEAVDRCATLPVPLEHQLPNGALTLVVTASPDDENTKRKRIRYVVAPIISGMLSISILVWMFTGAFQQVRSVLTPMLIAFYMPVVTTRGIRIRKAAMEARRTRQEREDALARLKVLADRYMEASSVPNLPAKNKAYEELLAESKSADQKRQEIRDRYLNRYYWAEINRFLSKYSVLVADVKDLSVRRLNSLYESGIRSAADIVFSKLKDLPELSPADRDQLVAWRKSLSDQFWRASSLSLPKEMEDQAEQEFVQWAKETANKLDSAYRELKVLTNSMEETQRVLRPQIVEAYQLAADAERDYSIHKDAIILDRESIKNFFTYKGIQ